MSSSSENVDVVSGEQQVARLTTEIIPKVNSKIDCVFQPHHSLETFLDSIINLKKQYIKVRIVTEITRDNLPYYKEINKHIDIRHLDNVKGSFMVCDGREYMGYLFGKQTERVEMLHITIESFVEAQQYVFDGLWTAAVPFKDKLMEIEEPHKRQFTERIAEAIETQRLIKKIINSATEEILLLFSTTNSFMRAEHDGLLGLLRDASNRGVKVRLLVHIEDDNLREKLQDEMRKNFASLSILYMRKPLERTITTLVRDRQVCLLIKVNDDSKESSIDATVDSTYSNSSATINSCVSIFESLWIQAELDSQKRIKQVYFQLFKGFKLKDENYDRQWSFEHDNQHE